MKRVYCDHEHSTGRFRGWLCNRCNTRLGGLDDQTWLNQALSYLNKLS
jgi:hypothetical protein